jgi:aminopeptidase N
MLGKVAAFELRYQLRSPLFFVGFAIFFLLTFGATTNEHIHIGSLGNVNINSPFAILQTTGIMNVFGVFVLVAFVANVVIRDDETGFAPIIHATRIRKFDYLVGRFIGAYLVAMVVLSSVPLAICVGSWMPWLDPEKIGPTVLAHYLYALVFYSAPTILTLGAGFFALATVTRSMMWTYVGVIAFLVLFLVAQSFLDDPTMLTAASLSDPFALAAFEQVTRYWTAADRNTQLPVIEGVLLYNRLIWIAVAVAMFAVAYRFFRFDAGKRSQAGKAARKVAPKAEQAALTARTVTPYVPTTGSAWRQLWALTRFDMHFVFASPAFFVLLAVGILNAVGSMMGAVDFRGTELFPVTRAVVGELSGAFGLFPVIIAIYYAGELVWRDRDRRMHEIVEATAAPDWTFLVPKVMAIVLVLLACFVVAVVTGMLFQIYYGYRNFEFAAYFLWFIEPGLVAAVLVAVLSVFAQVLVPHKALGWAIMLVYVISRLALNGAGFEHHLYTYAQGPEVPLSDMNGMGRFWIGRTWFQGYWLAFALFLLVASQLMWRRGVATFKQRFANLPQRFVGSTRWVAALAAIGWVGSGVYIFYNTNILNDYRTTPETEELTAHYEKALLPFEKVPQPRIVSVQLAVDIEPHAVRATTTGSYLIENRTGAALTEVHLRWNRPLKMQSLEVEGATLMKEYPEFDYRIYTFAVPMQPGEKRTIRFATLLEQRGFANKNELTTIADNGTFLHNYEISPLIGISRDEFLIDRTVRRRYGLPPDLRPPKLEDEAANANSYLRTDSDWVMADLTLTTDSDQTPIAPGYKVSDTVTGKRRTLVTRTDAPINNYFSFQSARYAVKEDQWTGKNGQPVELAVYFYPGHEYNVQRMLDAMKVSLDTFTTRFSPYQFHQARILEFPAYATFAESFPNTIPYSEGIGFIQNYDNAKSDEQIDLVTYVTAHEVGHQWWGHQIIGADKQGMTMLSESFAQYSALLVMEKLYGKEQIRKFLKYELDRYLSSRGGEAVEELPLNRVENQQYIHYRKGSLTMYWLKEMVGEEVVNRALRKLLAGFAFKAAPYPTSTDFIRLLRAEAGPEYDALITDLFEKITLYDMKASNATAKKLADGKYQVRFDVEAHKLYADGQGKETEAPLNEPFELGVFAVEPGKKGYTRESVLTITRQPMKSGKQSVEFIVDQLPKFAGVDPYNKRIDRNSDDNLTPVTLE